LVSACKTSFTGRSIMSAELLPVQWPGSICAGMGDLSGKRRF
jgi:hypothetical protein